MAKRWTDAKFEVVEGPRPRYELPQWFKTTVLLLAALFLLSVPIWRWYQAHPTAPLPADAGGTAAPQAPGAR